MMPVAVFVSSGLTIACIIGLVATVVWLRGTLRDLKGLDRPKPMRTDGLADLENLLEQLEARQGAVLADMDRRIGALEAEYGAGNRLPAPEA